MKRTALGFIAGLLLSPIVWLMWYDVIVQILDDDDDDDDGGWGDTEPDPEDPDPTGTALGFINNMDWRTGWLECEWEDFPAPLTVVPS